MKTIKTLASNVSVAPRGGRLGPAAGTLLAVLGFALSAPAATRAPGPRSLPDEPPEALVRAILDSRPRLRLVRGGRAR